MPRQAPLEKLPRHRHNLPRALVHKTQQRRVLRATAEVVAQKGYRAATVADIVSRAGVSTKTFYQLYADKDAALCAVWDAVDGIVARYYESHKGVGGGDPRERLHAAVAFTLERLAADATFTRLLIVEAAGSGKRIQAPRNQAYRPLAALTPG